MCFTIRMLKKTHHFLLCKGNIFTKSRSQWRYRKNHTDNDNHHSSLQNFPSRRCLCHSALRCYSHPIMCREWRSNRLDLSYLYCRLILVINIAPTGYLYSLSTNEHYDLNWQIGQKYNKKNVKKAKLIQCEYCGLKAFKSIARLCELILVNIFITVSTSLF